MKTELDPAPRNLVKALFLAAGVCGSLVIYLHIAGIQHGVNKVMVANDQSAYMNFARKAHASDFRYTGGRNRMPMFPWLAAIFYSPEMTEEEFFDTGKRLNVGLSLLILAALGAVFFARFSRLYASYAIVTIAFLFFVLKAPFFQADILYYGLFSFAFILSLSNLSAPTWRKTLAVGVLFGLTHFTKASALPALLIFCGSLGVLCISRLLRGQTGLKSVARVGSHALLVLFAFFALLFPYLQESYERYGSHFYNVNTTFYVWYDSWVEAKNGTRAAGDRVGYPDLPPEEIPSLEKYLAEHSLQQVFFRFSDGARRLAFHSCLLKDSIFRFGYCSQVAAGLVMLGFGLPLLLRRLSLRQISGVGPAIFFVFAVFLVYAMGAFWYTAITATAPRIIMVLIVPFFWTLGLVVHSAPVQEHRLRYGDLSVSTFRLVYGLFGLTLVYEIFLLAAGRAATLYGGS